MMSIRRAFFGSVMRPFQAKPSTGRRRVVIAMTILAASASPANASETAAWEALRVGAIVLFRHAHAPGSGDPAGMRPGDCATQRNLDAVGRAQAARIGEAFRFRGIVVGAVLHSQWCRATDTAELAFPGRGKAEAAFDSFFEDRASGAKRTAAARQILQNWIGPGALFISTHQVNITALTNVVPSSGEGVVLQRVGRDLAVIGRIQP